MAVLTNESNAAKSPHHEACVKPDFPDTDSAEAVVSTHTDLFFQTGKAKGLLVGEAKKADFDQRMLRTQGRLFWASREGVGLLDYRFATGKAREQSPNKINVTRILDCQNGGQFCPICIKTKEKEVFVARTNF